MLHGNIRVSDCNCRPPGEEKQLSTSAAGSDVKSVSMLGNLGSFCIWSLMSLEFILCSYLHDNIESDLLENPRTGYNSGSIYISKENHVFLASIGEDPGLDMQTTRCTLACHFAPNISSPDSPLQTRSSPACSARTTPCGRLGTRECALGSFNHGHANAMLH